MVKNLEEFKKIPFVSDLGAGRPSGKKLRLFIQNLNTFLQDSSFRQQFGFDKDKYSIGEGIILLKEIYLENYEYLFNKPKISIRRIGDIPEEMIMKFHHEVHGLGDDIIKVRESDVKYGAFDNTVLIGFMAAKTWREGHVIVGEGIYIERAYRQFGIGQQLIYVIIKEAKRRKLKGVQFNQMLFETKWMIEKLKKRFEAAKLPIKVNLYNDENYGFCADITFTKPT